MTEDNWYQLDTSALIYPAILSPDQASVYRLSCLLKETVDEVILQAALNAALQRFPYFKVKIKKGAFWFYFEQNEKPFSIQPEANFPCRMLNQKNNQDYLFTITWFENKISLEVFHVMADGTGGMEFLKSIVFYYLLLAGKPVQSEGIIKTLETKPNEEEIENSFLRYYDPLIAPHRSSGRAVHYTGTPLPQEHSRAIHGIMSTKSILDLVHQNNATITEYFTAILIWDYFDMLKDLPNQDQMVCISVPINLRKIFPSQTLRNFTFFINVGDKLTNRNEDFNTLLEKVKQQMQDLRKKEHILPDMNPNVTAEKSMIMRAAPLQLKKSVLKQAHRILGDDLFTMTLSNMGPVQIPASMKPYIERFDFGLGTSPKIPTNLSVCSFDDVLSAVFSSSIQEKNIEKSFFRFLSEKGIDITIQTSEG